MAVQYLCGRKTHKYRYQRSSTSLTLPSSWFLLIIVPVQPRQPPVGLLVTMYPPPVVVRHGWNTEISKIFTLSGEVVPPPPTKYTFRRRFA